MGNDSVNGMLNDTYKRSVNFEITEDKLKVISELEQCNYKTPPIKIAELLESFFAGYESYDGHWLYIAQNWTPRATYRTLKQMVKQQQGGWAKIQNPPAYFTKAIKFRTKRKSISIIGT
jgi:hypothetical protein